MDAILSILPQTQSASSAGGTAAPDAAGDGAFAALLAGQTAAVTPVPAIPSRPNGGNVFSPATTADTGPVLTALAQTPALSGLTAGPQSAAGDAAAAASLPASPTTGETSGVQSATPAETAITMPGHGGGSAGNGSTPDAANSGDKSTPSSPQIPTSVAGEPGASTNASGKTGTAQPASDNGAQTPLAEGADKSAVKTNMAAVPNGAADTALKSNEAAQLAQAAGTAQPASAASAGSGNAVAQTTTSPTTGAAATTPAAAGNTAAAALPQAPVQAGVQARREASGMDKMQQAGTNSVSKSGAAAGGSGANSAASASASAVKPEAATPPAPQPAASQTATPPPADLPAEAVRLAQGDAARTAPPPLDVANPDSASETEQADLSNLRAADASRAAERPGIAAGSARFTPAAAGALAAQIAAKFQNGERRFEIRMDPPELGRIEVKLQVGNDNRVQAILSAERPETLNDLRQYARELERALEDAGLELGNDGLSFELSQGEDDPGQTPQGSGRFSSLEFAEDLSGSITAAALPRELYGFQLSARSGIDIRL